MNSESTTRSGAWKRWVQVLIFVAFDIFAVNISYYVTLLLRFHFSNQFYTFALPYVEGYRSFAPYYTVCCLVIFFLFKLYVGEWKYAGLSDLNRILFACLSTCAVMVLGTLLFVRRMPISYYLFGAAIQFVMIFMSRFTYRFFSMEAQRYSRGKSGESVNTMIVGAGESAKNLIRLLINDADNLLRPTCIIDYRSAEKGRLFDGIPIAGDLDSIRDAAAKYQIKSVIIADTLMPVNVREQVKKICAELGLETQDFFGYNYYAGNKVTLRSLMEVAAGAVTIESEGRSLHFDNGEQATMSLPGKYLVTRVRAKSNELIAEIEKDPTVLNSTDEEWIEQFEKETGEQISFF